ncbi:unnamed protein product, partial [Discosporangium mesarthrocarpum]
LRLPLAKVVPPGDTPGDRRRRQKNFAAGSSPRVPPLTPALAPRGSVYTWHLGTQGIQGSVWRRVVRKYPPYASPQQCFRYATDCSGTIEPKQYVHIAPEQ